MPTTDRTLDWSALAAAGIDTDRVERETCPDGSERKQYRVISADGRTSLLFGEYHDPAEGGWDSMEYERVEVDDGTTWEPTEAPYWYETPAELLAAVKAWIDAERPIPPVLEQLNEYRGDNIWEDVIYRLDYDEAATNEVEHGDGRDVVIGSTHYHHDGGQWVVRD